MQQMYMRNANEKSTQKNKDSTRNRYFEFCEFGGTHPFPVTEFKLCKFATFLSTKVKTVESIKSYCAAICQDNELRGHKPAKRGLKFYQTIAGICRHLRHKVKCAELMTEKLLEEIEQVVNMQDEKKFVVWVTTVGGFYMILRKSNLVPLKRMHDAVHNITRADIRYDQGVMMIYVRWSKTNQFQESMQKIPLVTDNNSITCPVCWMLYMMQRIPAQVQHNLFCF